MKVKRYLGQIYDLSNKIKTRQEQLDELFHLMTGIKAITYDRDMVRSSISGDKMADRAIKYVEMAQDLEKLIDFYVDIKNQIISEIQQLPDKYSQVLVYRYVKHYKFEKIACEMNYDYDYVKVLHKKALQAFIETFPDKDLALNDLTDI